jgi:N-acetylmuramoyl-L-alanine amidase
MTPLAVISALAAALTLVVFAGCGESQGSSLASAAAHASGTGAVLGSGTASRRRSPTVEHRRTGVDHRALLSPTQTGSILAPPIIRRFIPYGPERRHQMLLYALRHYGIDSYRLEDPHLIIEHYTETPDFQSTFNTFAADTPDSEYHELPNTCAHFVVDTNGLIYQLVPLDLMCRHVVGLNYTAIGIENVGYSDAQILGDPRQLRSSLRLTAWLRCKFHLPIQNVIGHNESLSSPYYRELVPAFRGRTHSDFNRADMDIYRSKLRAFPCG